MTADDRINMAIAAIHVYYDLPGNECGGSLHIVLDDRNTERENVEWCRQWAVEHDDEAGVFLADLLLLLTPVELDHIAYERYDDYAKGRWP